jgi:uncharacterized protein (UPF0261 family)
VLNFGPRATVPKAFDVPERRLIVHNPYVTAVRTTTDEAEQLGGVVARKLNAGKGPRAVMLPLAGMDSYQQRPNGPFINPEADGAFLTALEGALDPGISIRQLDSNINDATFADATADTFLELWNRAGRRQIRPAGSF